MKIFLGGTCPSDKEDFDYRNLLIPLLEEKNIDYFNPVVEDWTDSAQEEEERQKSVCDVHLYFIAPNMKGVFSIAEAFGSLIQHKHARSIFVYCKSIPGGCFSDKQLRSLFATANLCVECGGEGWELDTESDINSTFVTNSLVHDGGNE